VATFEAFDVSLELVHAVRGLITAIAQHDPDLARQLKRATSSVPLNVSEGNGRCGGDRLHLWRVAAGSAREVAAALRVAEAWGHADAAAIAPAQALCDRVVAMLWRLTH
jgi:four helix bundle protein